MRRGDLNRCSFGFFPVRETWDEKAKPRVRTLHEVKLFDVSIVARPAYPATEAKVRKELADDGLDAEQIAEMLVRLRQGLPLEEADLLLMRRLVETCQRHITDNATEPPQDAPGPAHATATAQPALSVTGPEPELHPLSWYKDQLTKLGV